MAENKSIIDAMKSKIKRKKEFKINSQNFVLNIPDIQTTPPYKRKWTEIPGIPGYKFKIIEIEQTGFEVKYDSIVVDLTVRCSDIKKQTK